MSLSPLAILRLSMEILNYIGILPLRTAHSLLPEGGVGVTTLGQVATVDHLTSPNGIPRGNNSKSGLVYLVYHGRLSITIRVYRRAIAMVILSDKCGNQR